jgi:hypothetical protein
LRELAIEFDWVIRAASKASVPEGRRPGGRKPDRGASDRVQLPTEDDQAVANGKDPAFGVQQVVNHLLFCRWTLPNAVDLEGHNLGETRRVRVLNLYHRSTEDNVRRGDSITSGDGLAQTDALSSSEVRQNHDDRRSQEKASHESHYAPARTDWQPNPAGTYCAGPV